MNKQVEKIVNAINEGGSWNGKFYTDRKGIITTYVSGKMYMVGEVKWDGEDRKKAIEAAVNGSNNNTATPKRSGMTYEEAYTRYGLDFAEEGNY